ncbi:hypothetical protein K7G42_06815 [Streptococcus parauberis]|uniref:Phage protein n=1 Tax=Streptococcus parauberis KRS-02083 TaxID=1207545 RepID=A0ABP2SZA9_9STRE|nr:hypothetical protein [Streptococcus parauberis]EMG25786.1 hypothetical protein SPJ1_1197 [Streptococcus parauberis KRS-02083]QBX27509.1 hypothetical protein Javan392_0053 [Streptococcus phage Javan392]WEM64297.1 hypothetical protein P1T45_06520 [Streptococcus parauberis]WOF46127.1 hypothetical protein K7G42_06815 [Streptococcus parauberis]
MDLILQFGALCVALTGIWGLFSKLQSRMLEPFQRSLESNQKTLEENQATMKLLEATTQTLAFELKENQHRWEDSYSDRKDLRTKYEKLADKVEINQDTIIAHGEQLKTLWKEKVDKR